MKDILRPGCGQHLADARIAKGLTAADVANKLKLTVRQIEALEAEDLAHLPGEIFLRGFVRNYARFLEVDPEVLLMPVDAQATVSETITAHSEGVNLAGNGLKRWIVVPAVVLGIFVLFVAAVYQYLSQGEDTLVAEQAVDVVPATPAVTAPSTVASSAAKSETVTLAPTPDLSGAAPAGPVDVPAAASTMTAAAATSPSTPPSPVPDAAKPTPPAFTTAPLAKTTTTVEKVTDKPVVSTAGKRALRFAAAHDAWIQVVDGEGKRYSKLVRAGGEDSITGLPPFKLVVGEAAQVRLNYDGHAIDLTPYIGQKVARLTLE